MVGKRVGNMLLEEEKLEVEVEPEAAEVCDR